MTDMDVNQPLKIIIPMAKWGIRLKNVLRVHFGLSNASLEVLTHFAPAGLRSIFGRHHAQAGQRSIFGDAGLRSIFGHHQASLRLGTSVLGNRLIIIALD